MVARYYLEFLLPSAKLNCRLVRKIDSKIIRDEFVVIVTVKLLKHRSLRGPQSLKLHFTGVKIDK